MLNTNEVRIETSTQCNYRCVFCPHSTTFTRKHEFMSLRTFKFIVDKIKVELPEITDITISGFGEAFLPWDYHSVDRIRYAKDAGFKIHVLTNGHYFSHPIIDQVAEIGVEEVRISLHAIDWQTYKKLTNAPMYMYNKVIWNINRIIEETDINLVLTFEIIEGINDDQIEDIIKLYGDHATLEMWRPHNWVDTFKYRKLPIIRSTCGRPFNGPYQIQVDGTVNMCCFDYNGILLLGDFVTQTMEEIFNDAAYLNLKKYHEYGILKGYICHTCDQRKSLDSAYVYNNKFTKEERLYKTSTNYRGVL